MDVYVMGVAVHPAADVIAERRLQELAYRTARAALDDAGIVRRCAAGQDHRLPLRAGMSAA